jgi:hypothetical protein
MYSETNLNLKQIFVTNNGKLELYCDSHYKIAPLVERYLKQEGVMESFLENCVNRNTWSAWKQFEAAREYLFNSDLDMQNMSLEEFH